MAEWSKAHAWNACVGKLTEGSNPSLSAIHRFISIQNNLSSLKNKPKIGAIIDFIVQFVLMYFIKIYLLNVLYYVLFANVLYIKF